jgi:toxin FitB
MIIVDTNIISEPMRPRPDERVMKWLDEQEIGTLFLTATVVAEAFYGIDRLPAGKRKNILGADLDRLIATYFSKAVLPFDETAARVYASIVASASKRGQTIHVSDGQIAAVALIKGFSVATRDVDPFTAAGCKVINPWDETG